MSYVHHKIFATDYTDKKIDQYFIREICG